MRCAAVEIVVTGRLCSPKSCFIRCFDLIKVNQYPFLAVRFALSKNWWPEFAEKKSGQNSVLLLQWNVKQQNYYKNVGVGRFSKQTSFWCCAGNLAFISVCISMSKPCLSKNEWYSTRRCSTPAFSSSMTKDSSQLIFDKKNIIFCCKFFVGFNCSLPRKVMRKVIIDESLNLVQSDWIITRLRGVPSFYIIFFCLWNNWLVMCSHSSMWFFVSSTCACGIGFAFAACGVNTSKLATTTQLSSVYVWLRGLRICIIVLPFVKVTSAGETRSTSLLSKAVVASTAPLVGA